MRLINVVLLVITAISGTSAYAAQGRALDAGIALLDARSAPYTDEVWAGITVVTLDKTLDTSSNVEGCVNNRVYFNANENQNIYSMVLAMKATNSKGNFYIDKDFPSINGICRLVAVSY